MSESSEPELPGDVGDTLEIAQELVDAYGWEAGVASAAVWFFGPTIYAVRQNLGRWADFHSANVLRLNRRVQERIPEIAVEEDGAVHPRVAQQIIEHAPWISDDVQQEYLAGLLIASRTEGGQSERGAFYARLASGMTAQQSRIHRTVCAAIAARPPIGVDFGADADLPRATVWLPEEVLGEVITAEDGDTSAEFMEGCFALYQMDLLSGFGGPELREFERQGVAPPSRPGVMITPTTIGLLLYLWARGLRATDANELHRPLPPGPSELTALPSEFYVAGIRGGSAPY